MSEDLAAAVRLGFELANEHAKQLIALSTGVIAFSVTFLIERRNLLAKRSRWLGATWILHLVAIGAGVCAMSVLTGQLSPVGIATAPPSGIGAGARLFSLIQLLTFSGGMLSITVFGLGAIRDAAESAAAGGARPAPARRFFSGMGPALRSLRGISIFRRAEEPAAGVAPAPALSAIDAAADGTPERHSAVRGAA